MEAAHLAETEEQVQTFRSLYQLTLAATGVLDGPALVTLATDTASRLLGGASSALFWYDSDREVLKALADSSRRHSALTSQLPGEGAVGRAFITCKPVVLSPDSDPDPRLDGPDCKLLVAVPATTGDRTVGALMVRFDQERTRVRPSPASWPP